MSANRVWRVLARRTRDFLASPPLAEARRRLRRDPGRIVPVIDAGLAALEAGRTADALDAIHRILRLAGDPHAESEPAPVTKSACERTISMNDFTLATPTQEPDLATAMKVVYQWNYGSEVDELRRLYVKAAEAQWVAERDIDWDRPIDLKKFVTTPVGGGAVPIERNSYWRSLPEETRLELTRRTAAFRLSNFLTTRAPSWWRRNW